ncbi:MAG: single-stranded-DNA-specific exonuclease RecJ, partial [Pseudomonadota bacterium]
AGPFGSGNPAPVFAFPSHRIAYASVVGSGHVRVTLKSGDQSSLAGIAFGAAESPLGKALLQSDRRPIHVAGTLSRNVWQGRESVQIRIRDAATT